LTFRLGLIPLNSLAENFLDFQSPDEVFNVVQRFSGSIGLGLVYDRRVTQNRDPVLEAFSHVLEQKLHLLVPNASFYDYLPYIRDFVPDFIMPSKRRARKVREEGAALDARISKETQDRIAAGEGVTCFHAGMLQSEAEGKAELSPLERDSLSGTLVGAA
jgi:hypothetical protein